MANIVSTTKQLKAYREAVKAFLVATPNATPAQLKAQLETQDDNFKLSRYTQIADYMSDTTGLSGVLGGVISDSVTIATPGTLYVVGDTFVITGATGSGAGIKVTSVDTGGEILAVELTNSGSGYATPVVDLSGSGSGTGALTLSASAISAVDQGQLLEELLLETYP